MVFFQLAHFSWDMKHASITEWLADSNWAHSCFTHNPRSSYEYLLLQQNEDSCSFYVHNKNSIFRIMLTIDQHNQHGDTDNSILSFYVDYWTPPSQPQSMIGDNRQLVTARWTGWVWEITGRSSRMQEIYQSFLEEFMEFTPILKRKTGGCQRVTGWDLPTLGSQPIMPKNLPNHWPQLCCLLSLEWQLHFEHVIQTLLNKTWNNIELN